MTADTGLHPLSVLSPAADPSAYRRAFRDEGAVLETPELAVEAIADLEELVGVTSAQARTEIGRLRAQIAALAAAVDSRTHGFVPGETSPGLCARCGSPESIRLHDTSAVILARAATS